MADRRAPLIAIVGCDGSGKSTVSAAVLAWARRFGPAEAVHLGKQSGNVGRALSRLPMVGRSVDRTIERETLKTRGQRGIANPSPVGAVIVYGFVIRRLRRFRRMLALWRQGTIIVADRFPQTDVPGAYDGPGLSVTAPAGALVRRLALRERAAFDWMAGHAPDLVIRLNVDLATAHARKPDHKLEALRRKVEATPRFRFGGAPIVEIDSRRPLDEVVAEARGAVTATLLRFGYTAPAD